MKSRTYSYSQSKSQKLIRVAKRELSKEYDDACSAGTTCLSKSFRVVCMIGCTGHGKSSTANTICGKELFNVSASSNSETSRVHGELTRWQNRAFEDPVIVIDTPGIGDSRNRDTKHVANMVKDLKEVGYVHGFFIVLNY